MHLPQATTREVLHRWRIGDKGVDTMNEENAFDDAFDAFPAGDNDQKDPDSNNVGGDDDPFHPSETSNLKLNYRRKSDLEAIFV